MGLGTAVLEDISTMVGMEYRTNALLAGTSD